MADDKPKVKTVTVTALETHTYNGKTYEAGDTYEIDEALIDTIEHQGKALREDVKAARDKAQKAADKAADKAEADTQKKRK